jgi:F-type H+-transporting ATPase subunit epsilon
MTLHVEVVSPERILFSGDARFVKARTTDGEIAFLNDHAPFIGALGIGEVVVALEDGDERVHVAVHGGFVEVRENRVSLLSDVAELADQIDTARAQEAKSRAEQAVKSGGDDDEAEEAELALRRAQVRLEVADHA